jgi:hypothetical protein
VSWEDKKIKLYEQQRIKPEKMTGKRTEAEIEKKQAQERRGLG